MASKQVADCSLLGQEHTGFEFSELRASLDKRIKELTETIEETRSFINSLKHQGKRFFSVKDRKLQNSILNLIMELQTQVNLKIDIRTVTEETVTLLDSLEQAVVVEASNKNKE